jgi:hypothetical protein
MDLEGMISRINSWKRCFQICNIVTFDQRQVTHPDLKIWRLSLEEDKSGIRKCISADVIQWFGPQYPAYFMFVSIGRRIYRHAAFPGYEANYPAPLFKRAPEAKRIRHPRYRCGSVYEHLHHLRQPHEISFIEFASPLPARKILHSTILTIETDWVSFSPAQTFSWKTGDYGSHELISLSCIRIKTSESLPWWVLKYTSCGNCCRLEADRHQHDMVPVTAITKMTTKCLIL